MRQKHTPLWPARTVLDLCEARNGMPARPGGAAPRVVSLGIGESAALDLAKPAVQLCVLDPSVAHATLESRDHLTLFGLRPGTTLLLAIGADGKAIFRLRISVGGKAWPALAGSFGLVGRSIEPDETIRLPEAA